MTNFERRKPSFTLEGWDLPPRRMAGESDLVLMPDSFKRSNSSDDILSINESASAIELYSESDDRHC